MHFFFLKFMMEITFTQENYFSAVLEKPVFLKTVKIWINCKWTNCLVMKKYNLISCKYFMQAF